MTKRIFTVLLAAILFVNTFPVFAADNPVIVINEVFDDSPLNSIPAGVTAKGINARCVEKNGTDKAFYAKVWVSGAKAELPIPRTFEQMVFSFDIMKKGDAATGKILSFSGGRSFFNITKDDQIALEDGYIVGGLGNGVWHNYAVVLNCSTYLYDVYVDGKLKVSGWKPTVSLTIPQNFNFEFSPSDDNSQAEFFIDNIRAYSGSTLLSEKYFPEKKPSNDTVSYTLQTDKPALDNVYVNTYGPEGFSNLSVGDSISWDKIEETSQLGLHFNQKGTAGTSMQFQTGITNPIYVVMQMDICIDELATGKLYCMSSANDGGYANLFKIDGQGNISVMNRNVCKMQIGKWQNLAFIFDYTSVTVNIYADGKLIARNVQLNNLASVPEKISIGLETASTAAKNELWINNIKVYDGKTLRVFEKKEVTQSSYEGKLILNSKLESEKDATSLIGNDIIFMTNKDFMYFGGTKKKYSEMGYSPYKTDDGVFMLPVGLVRDSVCSDIELSDDAVIYKNIKLGNNESGADGKVLLDAPVSVKDGVTYIPVVSFAKNVLGKYVYCDERGFVLISDVNRMYKNSNLVADKFEKIDVIYRYMQYERPDTDELYNDMVAVSGEERPRLFIKKADIPAFRSKIQGNKEMKNVLSKLLLSCETHIASEPIAYEIPDGLRLFQSCDKVKKRLLDLGVAYLATGDKKYANRAWTEVENALSWKDWNVGNHFLDSGEIGPGIAFAYDVFYDCFTKEQRAFIRKRTEELFINHAVGVYTGSGPLSALDNRLVNSNWGAVCSTSMLLCALTFMGEEPRESQFMQKCEFLAVNALQGLEFPLNQLFPDGAVSEGVGYWEYYITHISWSANALVNMCGNHYGIFDSPGYNRAPEFMMHVQPPAGMYNYSGDIGTDYYYPPEAILIAKHFNNDEQMAVIEAYRQAIDVDCGARWLMWYEPIEKKLNLSDYPTDAFFEGQQIVAMRTDFSDNTAYVGIHGGANDVTTKMDKGSFIFDKDKIRWFIASGKVNQSVSGGYYAEKGLTLYRRRAEGQNCLVINPVASETDQNMNGITSLKRMESKSKGAITVFDLSDVYKGNVKYYDRGFYLGDDRNSLIVQDELELSKDRSEFYWFAHTYGDIEIDADGKGATVKQNGKTLRVSVMCDAYEWRLEERDTTPLFEENIREGEYSRVGMSKITIVGKASGKLNISVKFTMENDKCTPHEFIPIENWSIPDGERLADPILSSITVNGNEVENFSPYKKNYIIDWEYTDGVPVISAAAENDKVTVIQPKVLGEKAEIIVENSNGTKGVYSVSFNVSINIVSDIIPGKFTAGLPEYAELAKVKSVYGSENPQSENPDSNTVDGDFATRWSVETEGAYLEVDLGEVKELCGIASAYLQGSKRHYNHEIMVSEDGITYRVIYSGDSSGTTDEWEFFKADVKARFVRYVCHGCDKTTWNSITEFRPCVRK